MPPKKKKLKTALNNLLAKTQLEKKKTHYKQQQEVKVAQSKQKQILAIQKSISLYSNNDYILLIGEGNFSFAKSLADHHSVPHENLVATCYDSQEVLFEKYGQEVKDNVSALEELGATVLYNVDGTQLHKNKTIKKNRYSKIIFNFPHAGAGIKDQDRNVEANQNLLLSFFESAAPLLSRKGDTVNRPESELNEYQSEPQILPDGEIHVTIKTCKPYDLWAIRSLAKRTGELAPKMTLVFDPAQYPGYEHRRTLGFKEGLSKPGNQEILKANPKTYIFVRREIMEVEYEKSKQGAIEAKKDKQREKVLRKKKRKARHSSGSDTDDDDDGDDNYGKNCNIDIDNIVFD